LDLSSNELSGPIPSSFGNLTSLNGSNLSFNRLSGPIPSDIGDLTTLECLYLNNNELTGKLPPFLQSDPGYQVDVSCNHFRHPLPEWCRATVCKDCKGFPSLTELL